MEDEKILEPKELLNSLVLSIRKRNSSALKEVLTQLNAQKVDANYVMENIEGGNNPIFLACDYLISAKGKKQKSAAVENLSLLCKSDLLHFNSTSPMGRTPLVQLLWMQVEHNVFEDKESFTELVSLILPKMTNDDINIVDVDGNSALHYAMSTNIERDFFEALIKAGAEINVRNKFGDTPIHFGIKYQDIDVKKILILCDHGADRNLQDKNGASIIEAMDQKIEDLKKYAASDNETLDLMMSARSAFRSREQVKEEKKKLFAITKTVESLDDEKIKDIIQYSPERLDEIIKAKTVDYITSDGYSLLSLAIKYQQPNAVTQLLNHNAHIIRLKVPLDKNPVYMAINNSDLSCLKAICEHKKYSETKTNKNFTQLMTKIKYKGIDGETNFPPLIFYALSSNNLQAAEYLASLLKVRKKIDILKNEKWNGVTLSVFFESLVNENKISKEDFYAAKISTVLEEVNSSHGIFAKLSGKRSVSPSPTSTPNYTSDEGEEEKMIDIPIGDNKIDIKLAGDGVNQVIQEE